MSQWTSWQTGAPGRLWRWQCVFIVSWSSCREVELVRKHLPVYPYLESLMSVCDHSLMFICLHVQVRLGLWVTCVRSCGFACSSTLTAWFRYVCSLICTLFPCAGIWAAGQETSWGASTEEHPPSTACSGQRLQLSQLDNNIASW